MSKLETLPSDIYSLFDPDVDHQCSEENLEIFAQNIKEQIRLRLAKQPENTRPIRFSGLGKPDRQVWYEAHPDGDKEKMSGQTFLKFAYGALIEEFLLLLVREAGHKVEDCQRQVEVDGVTGSIDARIDDVVVDVKSASPYGYKKFKERTVTEDDPFGYTEQLSGYSSILNPGEDAAWLAMDKVSGAICVSPLSKTVIKHHDPAVRIEHLKKVIENETIPEKCYEDVPEGASGNRKLGTGCSYCPFKRRCYPDLRTFIYSTGPRFLTKVVKEPNVPEVTGVMID